MDHFQFLPSAVGADKELGRPKLSASPRWVRTTTYIPKEWPVGVVVVCPRLTDFVSWTSSKGVAIDVVIVLVGKAKATFIAVLLRTNIHRGIFLLRLLLFPSNFPQKSGAAATPRRASLSICLPWQEDWCRGRSGRRPTTRTNTTNLESCNAINGASLLHFTRRRNRDPKLPPSADIQDPGRLTSPHPGRATKSWMK